MKRLLLTTVVLMGAALSAANATPILTFGQTSGGDTVTATRTGSSTTITSDTQVAITQIAGTVITPTLATLTLTATNTGPATLSGADITQAYSGSFTITNGAANYLSGSFSDAIFGTGGSLTLSASNATAGESVTFSSNVISPGLVNGSPRSVSLSFTDVNPVAAIVSNTLRGFRSDISGDFSSNIPEPAALSLLGVGLLGLGLMRRRSH